MSFEDAHGKFRVREDGIRLPYRIRSVKSRIRVEEDVLVVASSTKSIGSLYTRFNALPRFTRPST